ncbi:hypothetical protein [Methanopyrus sp.]
MKKTITTLATIAVILHTVMTPPPASAALVKVDVVPCVDTDLRSSEDVNALNNFLTWCENNHVQVAAFYSDNSGIADVIKSYASSGVITLVGLHTTSHSLGGLPPSLQYWEIKFNYDTVSSDIGVNTYKALLVPNGVFDANTISACNELGINVILGDVGYNWEENKYGTTLYTYALVGYFNVGDNKIYYVPVLEFSRIDSLANLTNTNLETLLKTAIVDVLYEKGVIGQDDNEMLTLWILVHPYELNDSTTVSDLESFLSDIAKGLFDFTYSDGTEVVFELANPMDVLSNIESYKSVGEIPAPDYQDLMALHGYERWYELTDDKVVLLWHSIMSRWWGINELLAYLTANNMLNDEILEELRNAVEHVIDESSLYIMLEEWNAETEVMNTICVEDECLNTLWCDLMRFCIELCDEKEEQIEQKLQQHDSEIASIEENIANIENDINEIKDELSSTEERVSGLENEIETLSQQLSDISNEYDQELETLKQELSSLSEKVDEQSNDIESLKSEVEALSQETEGLRSEIGGIKEDIANVKSTIDEIGSELNSIKERVNSLEDEIEALSQQLSDMSKEYDQKLEALKQELEALSGEINEQLSRIESLEKRIEALSQDVQTLRSESVNKELVESLEREVSTLKSDVEALKQDVQRMTQELTDLSRKVSEYGGLKKSVDELTRKVQDLEKKVESLDEKINSVEAKISSSNRPGTSGTALNGGETTGKGGTPSPTSAASPSSKSSKTKKTSRKRLPVIVFPPLIPRRRQKASG